MSKKVKINKRNMKTLVPQASLKTKTQIKNVLDSNRRKMDLEESDIPFISSFVKALLKEQGEDDSEPIPSNDIDTTSTEDSSNVFSPEKNKQDFKKSLSQETDPSQFETQGLSPEVTQQNIEQIRTWSDKLDQFANFLNDPDKGTSLHRILADSDRPGSLLRGVTRKASDSITRIAGEVEKLKEVLNTFIITAPKKLRDQDMQGAPK
jgi:hypothetical protein